MVLIYFTIPAERSNLQFFFKKYFLKEMWKDLPQNPNMPYFKSPYF